MISWWESLLYNRQPLYWKQVFGFDCTIVRWLILHSHGAMLLLETNQILRHPPPVHTVSVVHTKKHSTWQILFQQALLWTLLCYVYFTFVFTRLIAVVFCMLFSSSDVIQEFNNQFWGFFHVLWWQWSHHKYSWAASQYKDRLSRYGDFHVKDKTVGETLLSLTWESLYWQDNIFILRR